MTTTPWHDTTDAPLDAYQRLAVAAVLQAVRDAVFGVQGECLDGDEPLDWASQHEARLWLVYGDAQDWLDYCGLPELAAEIRRWVLRGCPVGSLTLRLLKQEEA